MAEKLISSFKHWSEEWNESHPIPSTLKCDACWAISYQIYHALLKEQLKVGKESYLQESDIINTIDTICKEGFNEYGIKQINGLYWLSGPGLKADEVKIMLQMGGRWAHRLQEMCLTYVGEIGELGMYLKFRESIRNLAEFLCYGKGLQGYCITYDKTEL